MFSRVFGLLTLGSLLFFAETGLADGSTKKARRRSISENSYFSEAKHRRPETLTIPAGPDASKEEEDEIKTEELPSTQIESSAELALVEGHQEEIDNDGVFQIPLEMLARILSLFSLSDRFVLCSVSHNWLDAIDPRQRGLIVFGCGFLKEIRNQKAVLFLPRRSLKLSLKFDLGTQRYTFRKAEGRVIKSSLSQACGCTESICLSHRDKQYQVGNGNLGGTVSWMGVSDNHEMILMTQGSSLFAFHVENQVIPDRQLLSSVQENNPSSETPYIENMPLSLIQAVNLGAIVTRGFIFHNVLLLFSGGLVLLIDLVGLDHVYRQSHF